MSGTQVLVTGGTGFVAAHCIRQLLDAGHTVRTTVRSPGREQEVRAALGPDDQVEIVVADLISDDGWPAAVAGCEYVLHVASPFPARVPKHEDDLIVPARDGALRVLRAARAAGVRRVVLTSSFAAIGYGHPDQEQAYTEQDWTDLAGPGVSAYAKSKTLAERAAWDFTAGGSLELAVVNPVGVFGPVLGPTLSTSMSAIQRMLNGGVPVLPHVSYSLVDARDVADLHLRAMTDPAAAGERVLAVAGEPMWMSDLARVLRDRVGVKVTTRVAPDLLVRLVSRADPALRAFTADLGKVKRASADKARRVLGWRPRGNEELIVDCARGLIDRGLVKPGLVQPRLAKGAA